MLMESENESRTSTARTFGSSDNPPAFSAEVRPYYFASSKHGWSFGRCPRHYGQWRPVIHSAREFDQPVTDYEQRRVRYDDVEPLSHEKNIIF